MDRLNTPTLPPEHSPDRPRHVTPSTQQAAERKRLGEVLYSSEQRENEPIHFEVQGIEAIGWSDGEIGFSARVWGSMPEHVAFVRVSHDWRTHGQMFGSEVTARYVKDIGYVVVE